MLNLRLPLTLAVVLLVGSVFGGVPFERSTDRSIQASIDRLEATLAWNGLRVVHVHDLAASLKAEGIERPPYFVVEACNAGVASQLLNQNQEAGSLLPCAIAVYTKGDQTVLSTLPATELAQLAGIGSDMATSIKAVDAAIQGAIARASQPEDWKTAWLEASEYYKRALVATNMDDPAAPTAVRRFASSWDRFYKDFGSAVPEGFNGSTFREMIDEVGRRKSSALQLSGAGKLLDSHEELEAIRAMWMKVRLTAGEDWLADRVTAFHDAMEPMIVRGKGKTPKDVSDADWDFYRQALAKSKELWSRVLEQAPEADKPLRRMQWDKTAAPIQKTLDAIQQAIDVKSSSAILESAPKLKPSFVKFFLAFG